MQYILTLLAFLPVLSLAAVLTSADTPQPTVQFPWGTWQADLFDPAIQLYKFSNIRFGKSTTGALRFQKPVYPDKIAKPETLMNSSYGPACYQVDTNQACVVPKPNDIQSEDCLFLDVYMSNAAWQKVKKGKTDTPVVVWFYGGAFEFGAKSAFGPKLPFYSGDGIITAASNSKEDFIFVTGNYRLGAFGWLSGPTIESKAAANIGLYDQRLVLQWVQDFIHLFGGDKTEVSAWGESAGAGSIMHHLIAKKGTLNPLFKRAFLQSPAFQWQWDNTASGTLEQVFRNFTKAANCKIGDFDCLVKTDVKTLVNANQQMWNDFQRIGLFPFGPAIDNDLILELPAIAYSKGHIFPGLESLAISHTTHEADSFTPKWVKTESDFNEFLSLFIREDSLENIRQAIKIQYPSSAYNGDQQVRLNTVIRDGLFGCNTRQMFDGYSPKIKVYMMIYDFGRSFARHASDLLPTFWNPSFDIAYFLQKYQCITSGVTLLKLIMQQLAPLYQRYLADFAVSGNPNLHPDPENIWQPATVVDGEITNALRVQQLPYFDATSTDDQNTKAACDFWYQVSVNITSTLKHSQSLLAKNEQEILMADWEL